MGGNRPFVTFLCHTMVHTYSAGLRCILTIAGTNKIVNLIRLTIHRDISKHYFVICMCVWEGGERDNEKVESTPDTPLHDSLLQVRMREKPPCNRSCLEEEVINIFIWFYGQNIFFLCVSKPLTSTGFKLRPVCFSLLLHIRHGVTIAFAMIGNIVYELEVDRREFQCISLLNSFLF